MSRDIAITCDRCNAEIARIPVRTSDAAARVRLPTGATQCDGGPGNDSGPWL